MICHLLVGVTLGNSLNLYDSFLICTLKGFTTSVFLQVWSKNHPHLNHLGCSIQRLIAGPQPRPTEAESLCWHPGICTSVTQTLRMTEIGVSGFVLNYMSFNLSLLIFNVCFPPFSKWTYWYSLSSGWGPMIAPTHVFVHLLYKGEDEERMIEEDKVREKMQYSPSKWWSVI